MAAKKNEINLLLSLTENPSFATSEGAHSFETTNVSILGQLFKISPHFELIPNQIAKYTWDEVSKTYKLKLSENLYFHNGRKANAKDLEFSLLRGFFSSQKSFYDDYVGNIFGIEAISPGTKFKSGLVTGVKILGEFEISIKLKRDNPSFLHSLVNPFLALVPKEELEDDLLTWKKYPIGAGPYKVIEKFDGKCLKLEKIEKKNRSVDFVNLCTAYDPMVSYDIVSVLPDKFNLNNYEEFLSKDPISTLGIYFLFSSPISNDINFRKAVYYGINRAEITSGLSDLTPSFELLSSMNWGRVNQKDPYDLKKAKDFVKKIKPKFLKNPVSGLVFGGKSINPRTLIVIDRIVKNLEKIGIKTKISPTTEKFLSTKTAEHFDIKFSSMISEHFDPLIMFASFCSNSSFVYYKPLNGDKKFDELYLEAANENQKEERVKTIQALSSYLIEKAYFVPYAEKRMLYWVKKNKFISMGTQAQAVHLNIEEMELHD